MNKMNLHFKYAQQKRLCHICACERFDFESQGFIPNGKRQLQNTRFWYYFHPKSRKRATIRLDLDTMFLKIYINGIEVKSIE